MTSDGVFVIAEAGVNHDGELEKAIALIEIAAEAGADAVKFQSFRAEDAVCSYAPKADYQLSRTSRAQSQLQMIKALELRAEDQRILHRHAQEWGIRFMSTAFDIASLDLLLELKVEPLKIASGEITNLPMLRRIGAAGKDVIMSTGMATMREIADAILVLEHAGLNRDRLTLLHCNTEYPTPLEDVNLRAMDTMKEKFGVPVGYSDHTQGVNVAIAAVALGASVIEKHVTLDRQSPGPDHAASIEPDELVTMVRAIREVERALGAEEKAPSPSEAKNISVARRSIVASRSIEKGQIITEDMIAAKRPGTGLTPMRWDDVVGSRASRAYRPDEQIDPSTF